MKNGPNIGGRLWFEPVGGVKRLLFVLREYIVFSDGEEGGALHLDLPWPLSPLSLALHIIQSHALTLFELPCYFVKVKAKIVGVLAVQEHDEGLYVASLGVDKEYRRLGIGGYCIGRVEAIAKRMGKKWLEVDVLRKNVPAQRLYEEHGFVLVHSGGQLLRGRKRL